MLSALLRRRMRVPRRRMLALRRRMLALRPMVAQR
jgi:hypothetical protein